MRYSSLRSMDLFPMTTFNAFPPLANDLPSLSEFKDPIQHHADVFLCVVFAKLSAIVKWFIHQCFSQAFWLTFYKIEKLRNNPD